MRKGSKHTPEAREKMKLSALKPEKIQSSINNLPKDTKGENNSFFGKSHSEEWRLSRAKDKHPNWKGGNPICPDCKEETTQRTSIRCKECYLKFARGENHPNWKGGYANTLFLNRRRRAMKFSNGGHHTLQEWESLKEKYLFTCPSCNRSEPEIKLTLDHIIPLVKGGTDDIGNIQPLCSTCNCSKGKKVIKYELRTTQGVPA